MISAKRFKIFLAGMCCVILPAAIAMGITVGEKAPYFQVTSGSNEVLTSDMLKGKMAVVFYETKETKEKNRALKDELNVFYSKESPEAQKNTMRVAVIRCSQFMPVIWRQALRKNSKKEGIIIYGDWDGSMEKSYGMVPDESNFLIIDKSGTVRYVGSGIIPEKDFDGIEKMLKELEG